MTLKKATIHGRLQIIKIIDGEPYLPEKDKKKGWLWVPTLIEESRLKKFRDISEQEMAVMLMEGKK